MLDTLFIKLQSATDPSAIKSLEAAIWEQWVMVPDMGQRALMMRGIAEMQQQELKASIETFTRLIGLAPGVEGAQVAWEAHAFGFLTGLLLIGPLAKAFGAPRPAFASYVGMGDPRG